MKGMWEHRFTQKRAWSCPVPEQHAQVSTG